MKNLMVIVTIIGVAIFNVVQACDESNPDTPPDPTPSCTTNCGDSSSTIGDVVTTTINDVELSSNLEATVETVAIGGSVGDTVANGGNTGAITITNSLHESGSGGGGGAKAEVSNSGNASLKNVGNSQISVKNTYRVPMRLITPELIDPIVTGDVIFPELDGQTVMFDDDNGSEVAVTFVVTQDFERVIIKGLQGPNAPHLLGTAQNHGKKLFARLYSRTGEFVAPIEQAGELLAQAPEGTKAMFVRVRTTIHTRGTAGIGGAGHDNNRNFIESIAGKFASSYYLAFAACDASYYDKKFVVVKCDFNDERAICQEDGK